MQMDFKLIFFYGISYLESYNTHIVGLREDI